MSMPSDPRTYRGGLSDGRSADHHWVDVSLAQGGVEMRSPELSKPLLWPYDKLRSGVPLKANALDVLLSLQPDGAQTLFVANPGFAEALLARAPALSAASQRWRCAWPGLAVTAVVALLVAGMWMADLHPAQAVARVMPEPTRKSIGRAVIADMRGTRRVCEVAAGRAALDRLTQRLMAGAAETPGSVAGKVEVAVLDWPLVNAFAVPGGQVVLTSGLIRQATSSDEVAGVLAHEIGHTIELHPETGLVRALGLAAAAQLVLAGSTGTVSNLGLILTQLRYTRIAEREADAHALRLLKTAGISAKGIGDFFERLEKSPGVPGSVKRVTEIEVIRTHPLTKDRLAEIRAQPAYPATPAMSDGDWQALRAICGAQPAPAPRPQVAVGPPTADGTPMPAPEQGRDQADADREIADATQVLATNPNDVATLRKRAQAYGKKGDHAAALADYVKAIALRPGDPNLHYGRGLALQNLQRHEEAIAAYDETLKLAPAYANARNNRGNVNRTLKRYPAALQDFDELIRNQPNYVHAYYNRGLVHRDQNNHDGAIRDFNATISLDKDYTAAYTSRALSHERMNARQQAIDDYKAALALAPKYNNGAWAHRTARDRLKALGVDPGR